MRKRLMAAATASGVAILSAAGTSLAAIGRFAHNNYFAVDTVTKRVRPFA